MPTDLHLLVATEHGWKVHCGATTLDAVVPLSLKHRVTCPGCLAWPHPDGQTPKRTPPGPCTAPAKASTVVTPRPTEGAAVRRAGAGGLIGGRGQPMNQLETAAYAVLRADPLVLAVHAEPFPLPLGKGVMFWVDFEVFRWGKSGGIEREWVEVKPGKYTSAGNLVALYRGDGRTKWKLFCDRWHHLGVCTIMIGWREQGAYHFERREETP